MHLPLKHVSRLPLYAAGAAVCCVGQEVARTQTEGPPVAERKPVEHALHGRAWTDEYAWMRNRKDPKVKAYLEAENAYTTAQLEPLRELKAKLLAELKSRVVEEDVSVPFRKGNWLYYSRETKGKDHSLLCRKPYPEGKEELLLDLNVRAGKSQAYSFGGAAVTGDEQLYAWKENHDGTDSFVIQFKHLPTGKLLPDKIPGSAFHEAPVWALDNKTLFYTEADETERSCRVKRHTLGQPASADVVVYEEKDARFQVSIGHTKSDRFLLISSSSKDTDETSLIPLDQPDAKPQVVVPRKEGIRYDLADQGDRWYILSNEGAVNGRLWQTPLGQLGRVQWKEVLPADDNIAYTGVDAFASHVVLDARKNGVPGMFVLDSKTGATRWIAAPKEGASFDWDTTPEYESTAQRVSYETFLDPYTVADVDLATGEFKILKQKQAPPGYDAGKYRIERTDSRAADGETIPIWLCLPVNHPMDGSGGLLLSGYGAYGASSDPWFDSDVISLLDRGVGYAVAQVRGGGEMGRRWYEAGKLAAKQNTFSDFIACAEHLIKKGYTSPSQLCGQGASAGGLLGGAVVNQRPDLFRAFVLDVPFVDALNTMLDPTIPLTTSEYDEWGNPTASAEAFDHIRAYAPYENVKKQDYPALLVLAGWNDTRVPYWEAAKWVARLRAAKTDTNTILLKTEFDTGHGGVQGRYSHLEEEAMEYAFILQALGREGR